jgi:hypothetical protein
MLDDGALAISIPVLEWKSTRPKGSVFFRRDIPVPLFSPSLVRALDLVSSACAHAGFEPVFVARPEIFTHGESLAWLIAKLGRVRDHLSLSDGGTVKLIPGLRNHVLFYGLSRRVDAEALDRLKRRFPELFDVIHSQVNTALRLGSRAQAPAPVAIEGAALPATTAAFYPISLHAFSPTESLRRTWLAGAQSQLPRGFEELTYVPLTEASLGDPGFITFVASLYDVNYFTPARGLVLRVPETFGGSSELEDRFEASLAALVEGGSHAPLARARNAWLASEDVPAAALAAAAGAVSFLAHDTFDFWRAAPTDYRLFRSRKVIASRDRNLKDEFDHLIAALCGADTEILWRGAASVGFDPFASQSSTL